MYMYNNHCDFQEENTYESPRVFSGHCIWLIYWCIVDKKYNTSVTVNKNNLYLMRSICKYSISQSITSKMIIIET